MTSTNQILVSAIAPLNRTVLNVTYDDVDGDVSTFAITAQFPPTTPPCFRINATTGAVVISRALVAFSTNLYIIQVEVKEKSRYPQLTGVQNVTVVVQGDYPPTFVSDPTSFVLLNRAVGTVVYTARAVSHINDSDTLTYAIVGGNSSAFTMDSATGVVRTAIVFTPAMADVVLIIQATDYVPAPPPLTTNLTLPIKVLVSTMPPL